jgi:uncharacterized protein YndB with AHSA1/START domain
MATLPADVVSLTPGGRADGFDATRGFTLTRTFPAPRTVVWRAISERELFARWFGADVEFDLTEWDLREGGVWRGTMTYEGNEIPWVGRFVVVDEPERLAIEITDQGDLDGQLDLVSMTLTEKDGVTEMFYVQNGGGLTDEQYEGAKEGTESFLDAIAVVVADIA